MPIADLTMPPAPLDLPVDPDEQKRRAQQLVAIPPAPIPSAQPATAAPSAPAMPPATVTPLTGRDRDLAISATNQPAMPPANAAPAPEAPSVGGPMMPPATIQTANPQPPMPNGPQMEAYNQLSAQGAPKLSGWRKALDVIGSMFPLGRGIETSIPGTPQNYDARLTNAAMRAAREQKLTGGERQLQEEPEDRDLNRRNVESEIRARDAKTAADQPETPSDKKIDEYVNDQQQRVLTFEKADGTTYDKVGHKVYEKPEAPAQDANKLAGEIEAQVGPKPTTPQFGGKTYPTVQSAQAAWGKAAEEIKNAEAASGAAARGASYNQSRPVQVLVPQPDGTMQPVYMSAAAAEAGNYAPASVGAKAVSQTAQFDDIVNASQQVRNALKEAGNEAFTPTQTAKLSLAMKETDPTVMRDEIANLAASGLTPAQQDLVTWLYQLQERALSLRSVAGMGQGSDTTRLAIIKALPSITSGNVGMATKQLDAFDNMVGNLRRGILTVRGRESGGKPAAPKVGTVEGGYKFKGGDPAKKENWEKE